MEAWDRSLEASHTLAVWYVGTCVQNVLNLVIDKRGPVRQHSVSTCVSSVRLTDDCWVWFGVSLGTPGMDSSSPSWLHPDSWPLLCPEGLVRAAGAFCLSPILWVDFVIAEPEKGGGDSPLLGFWGVFSLGKGGWLRLVFMGEAGYSAQWRHWSSIPGREEERKEVASFLGLGTWWMDGLESASGEGMGMRGLALEIPMRLVVPEVLQKLDLSQILLCVVAFDLKSYTSSWQVKPVPADVTWSTESELDSSPAPAPTRPGCRQCAHSMNFLLLWRLCEVLFSLNTLPSLLFPSMDGFSFPKLLRLWNKFNSRTKHDLWFFFI